jgi:hypothetical protein
MRNFSLFPVFTLLIAVTNAVGSQVGVVPHSCLSGTRYVSTENDYLISEINVLDESRLSVSFTGWWHGTSVTLGYFNRIDEYTVRVWLSPGGLVDHEAIHFVMKAMTVEMNDSSFEISCLPNSSHLRVGRLVYQMLE